MDFVCSLSMRDPKDSIWAIMDIFTKSAHYLAINKVDNTTVLANLYVEQIVRLHGVPVSIISDRDSKIKSAFQKAIQKSMGKNVHMSTTYHPQID